MLTEPIVVGVDGCEKSRAALRWAVEAAVRQGRGLRIVGVFDPVQSGSAVNLSIPAEFVDAMRVEVSKAVAAAVAYVRSLTASTPVDTEVVPGPAASVLTEQGRGASVVVIGDRPLSGIKRLLFGSVSLDVVAHATRDVVVVAGPPGGGSVVVGVDGSPLTGRVLERAFAAADELDAGVTVVHTCAIVGDSTIAESDPRSARTARERALQRLSGWVAPLAEKYPCTPVRTVVTTGGASTVIVRESSDARLIVVGTQGRGRLAGMLLGSTSQNILHQAQRPVLVVNGVRAG